MHRHSVASFPFMVTQGSFVDKTSLLELLNPKRDGVTCQGTSAKLHDRGYGVGEDKQLESPRRISVSYKSLLGVAPPQIKRRMSTPASTNASYRPAIRLESQRRGTLNGLLDISEANESNSSKTGNENPANQNTRKQSEDHNTLPQITATTQNPKSVKKKKRRKNGEKDEKAESTAAMLDRNGDVRTTINVESNTTADSPSSVDGKADENNWKWRLHMQFHLEREMTRPYTYSYFPVLTTKKKKDQGKRKKRSKLTQ